MHELLNDVSNLEGVEEILFLEECSLYESNVFVITKPQANKDQLRQKLAQTITHLKTKYPWASLSPMILEKNSPLIPNIKKYSKEEWHDWERIATDTKREIEKLEGVEECVVLPPKEYVWESNVFVITKPQANKDQLRQKLAQTITHLKTKYPWASLSPMILEKNSIAHKTFITKSARAT